MNSAVNFCVFLCICLNIGLGVADAEVKTVCDSLKTKNETVTRNKQENLLDIIYQMNSTINELKANLTQVQYSQRTDVKRASFLAVMTERSQSVLNRGIVRFPVVRHNVAPSNFGYDEKLSFFRCPEHGTYMFAATLSVYKDSTYNKYSIMKEGTVLASAYTYTYNGHGKRTCSITVTSPCKKGEDVWVANTYSSTSTVYSDSDGNSHFTGFRLY